MDENTILFFRITDHLKLKENKQDDLNGIILAIYETEMKNLSQKVIMSLSHMIKKGIVTEFKTQGGKSYYQLVNNKNSNRSLNT